MSEAHEPQDARVRPNAFARVAFFSVRHCIAVLTLCLAMASMAGVYAVIKLFISWYMRPIKGIPDR